jgi:hypothetical protein
VIPLFSPPAANIGILPPTRCTCPPPYRSQRQFDSQNRRAAANQTAAGAILAHFIHLPAPGTPDGRSTFACTLHVNVPRISFGRPSLDSSENGAAHRIAHPLASERLCMTKKGPCTAPRGKLLLIRPASQSTRRVSAYEGIANCTSAKAGRRVRVSLRAVKGVRP